MVLEIGRIVDNRYRIVKLLGQGGMGAVYSAWDTRLNRAVALKEMTCQPGLHPKMLEQLRQQFEHEAQVLATLSHPNLVRVTDYFSWDENEYLVMDFVEGESLETRIQQQGPRSEAEALRLAGQLLDVLSYCHRRGVLHRDIKPENIIITQEGNAILVDFGLVKLWNPKDPKTRTVIRGAGTPEYAPPEQYDLGHTDPRSDIYSVGATLYHALTGRAPPTATQRIANPSSFVPPRRINFAISPPIEAAILKAMEVAMDRRFQSAEEMAQVLRVPARAAAVPTRRAAPGRTAVLPETRPEARPAVESRRGRGLWIGLPIAVVLCVVLGGVGAVGVYYLIRETGTTPTPQPIAVEPSATPALEASPIPPPTSAPTVAPTSARTWGFGDIALYDAFSDPGSGWEIGDYEEGSVGYAEGYYYVASSQENTMNWGVANQSFADVVIEVEATQVSAPTNDNNAYGVMCRVQSDDDGYLLRISGDGLYAIHRVLDGEFERLVDWAPSDAIRQGNATNHIRAVCDGTRLALIVNGQLLDEAEDATFTEGDIALVATTFEDESTEIHFDNLVVSAPGMEVLFQDDFSDTDRGWEVWEAGDGALAEYGDGTFRILATTGGWMWGRPYQQFTDVVIDVVATQISAPPNNNNGYGVMCRVQSDEDGYLLAISGDGLYAIYRLVDGDFEELVPWTRSNVIQQGSASNHIRALCEGTRLALVVNGEVVAEAEDSTYSEGDIALMVNTYEDEPTEVHFDNLIVSGPPD